VARITEILQPASRPAEGRGTAAQPRLPAKLVRRLGPRPKHRHSKTASRDRRLFQAILRHTNVAVTQKCYIKTASDQTLAAMQKLETALSDTFVTPKQRVQVMKNVM
jgi:hypothetical protein